MVTPSDGEFKEKDADARLLGETLLEPVPPLKGVSEAVKVGVFTEEEEGVIVGRGDCVPGGREAVG
jgi:hypothetical protein